MNSASDQTSPNLSKGEEQQILTTPKVASKEIKMMWQLWRSLKRWSAAPSFLEKEMEDEVWFNRQQKPKSATQQTIIRINVPGIKNKSHL